LPKRPNPLITKWKRKTKTLPEGYPQLDTIKEAAKFFAWTPLEPTHAPSREQTRPGVERDRPTAVSIAQIREESPKTETTPLQSNIYL
jgi:hypothetical protein